MNDEILRPTSFEDYVGQPGIKENLRVFVAAAKMRKTPLGHVLLSGSSGCGKTSLAGVIANALGTKLVRVTGRSLTRPDQLAFLLDIDDGDILFIDEIHGLNYRVKDALLLALEDFRIYLPDAETGNPVELSLPRFTCVAATTLLGSLDRPLRERFPIFGDIGFLRREQLVAILRRSAKLLGASATEGGLHEIAARSRNTPRVANNLLGRVHDFSLVKNAAITEEFARAVLNQLGIDGIGLNATDKKILLAIGKDFNGGPVGLGTLASITSESAETIALVCEPYLLSRGFLTMTPKGRMITDKAREYLEIPRGG